MRKLTILFILLVSTVMFSSPSYAKWTKVGENVDGDIYYVDFERIRKHSGYVYYWSMLDYLKPTPQGHLSFKSYKQGDCSLFRFKYLNEYYHKEPMGRGTSPTSSNKPDKEWNYPPPNSVSEDILKSVCSR